MKLYKAKAIIAKLSTCKITRMKWHWDYSSPNTSHDGDNPRPSDSDSITVIVAIASENKLVHSLSM